VGYGNDVVGCGLWKSCKLFGLNKYKTYLQSLFSSKQLSIFTISKSRKPKAKSKVQGAFKTLLLKSSGFWFPPLWLAFDFLEAKSAPKSPTKGTQSHMSSKTKANKFPEKRRFKDI